MSQNTPFFFVRTLWDALYYADWDAAAKRGVFALITEFFRALTGLSAWPFFVPLASDWRPATIRPILQAHGIESWGWGKQGDEFFFQVKLRQANWAQYLLQQYGVPLRGQLLDETARSAYRPAPHHTTRSSAGARITTSGAIPQPTPDAETPTSPLRDPVGQINRAVDRLARW